MVFKRALKLSLIMHIGLFAMLVLSLSTFSAKKKPLQVYEAHMVWKGKERKKDLLPKKAHVNNAVSENKTKEAEAPKEIKPPAAEPAKKQIKEEISTKPAPTKAADKKNAFADMLKNLSSDFRKEIDEKATKKDANQAESEVDNSYFDQIYTLIKEAFVVPEHINGPSGRNLRAVIKIYLDKEGSISKLTLEKASGDEHFDKAVMDGTKRVNNFGTPPLFLISSLSRDGVMIELCPFKCGEN